LTTRRTLIVLMLIALLAIVGYGWLTASRPGGTARLVVRPAVPAAAIAVASDDRGDGLVGGGLWWP
jgi:hypothetical protein